MKRFACLTLLLCVLTICLGCSPDSPLVRAISASTPLPTVTPTPTPSTPTPLPLYGSDRIYIECEGTDPPHRKMLKVFLGNFPECSLEGQRLRVSGTVYDADTEGVVGNVSLLIGYILNAQSDQVNFGGVILQDLSLEERAPLLEGEEITATCTVGLSAPIKLMGTARVLTDCTL